MAGTSHFHWETLTKFGDEKADRRVISGQGGDLKRVSVKAGTIAERHSHDFEQFFMVLEGKGVLHCELGDVRLYPGVVVHFEPEAWHSAEFETDTVLVEVNFAKA